LALLDLIAEMRDQVELAKSRWVSIEISAPAICANRRI
jgi:hypothetical protein